MASWPGITAKSPRRRPTRRTPAPAWRARPRAALGPTSSSTSTSTSVDPNFSVDAPSSPWRAISDNATSKADYFAQLNDPTRSDLPLEDARALDALGAKLARADTTGEGRDAFPGYWGDGGNNQGPCCRNLVIHASSATRYGGGPDVAQVAVIWSADRPGGQPVSEETTVYYFARQAGGWKPLHSWELPQ